MFKKLFIGLAPLLAIAAFAVMPVAAQAATQHWYSNAAKATEGEEIPIVVFGNEVNLADMREGAGVFPINCKTAGGGTIENPGGGGAGVGRTNLMGAYECKAEQCEKAVLEKFGVQGRGTIT